MPASYKDRLSSFEVQPPKAAWNHISEELERSKELLSVSEKLFDYEVIPPVNSWKAIVNSLETANHLTNVRSLRRTVYSTMAAASILGAIAIAFFFFYKTNITKSGFATVQTETSIRNNIPQQEPTPETASLADEHAPSDSIETVMETPPKARKDYQGSTKVLQTTTVKKPLFLENQPGIMIAAKPIRNARGEVIQNTEILNSSDNQYISITGPNGQQTKISSKFLQMLSFINDDNDDDEVDGYFDKNFLQSLIWKSRFQEWRNKIINTSFVPSSTNFMDILEFRDLILKDK